MFRKVPMRYKKKNFRLARDQFGDKQPFQN